MRGKDHHVACPQSNDYVPFCVKKEDIYGHMVWVDEYGEGDMCDEYHDSCNTCGEIDCRCDCKCDYIYDSMAIPAGDF